MDRRAFLTVFIGAAAGLALASESAAALTLAQPSLPPVAAPPENAVLTDEDSKNARIEKARVHYHRRPRARRRVVRRRSYRRYPVYRHRRFYGPRYYHRPRYHWGPRVYRRYWW